MAYHSSTIIASLTLVAIFAAFTSATAQHPAPSPAPTGPFEFHTMDEAWQVAQESQQPILLFVTSDHCHYCRKMESDTFSHPKLQPAFAQFFEMTEVNARSQPELVARLGVRAFPTTVVISPNGRALAKLEGYIGPRDISKRLNPVLTAYRDQVQSAADREQVAQH